MMGNVVNKATVMPQMSVDEASFDSVLWLINPASLPGLIAANVPQYYWKVVGLDVAEMNGGEKAVVDAMMLPDQKVAKISQFAAQTQQFVVTEGYDDSAQKYLSGLLADAYGTGKANRAAYITTFLDWINSIYAAYGAAKAACEAAVDQAALAAVVLDLSPFSATNPDVTPEGALAIPD